jgi:hypothetical protein
MFLANTSEFAAGGKSYKEMFDEAASASAKPFDALLETITSIQDQTLKTQRNIFNIALPKANQDALRNTFTDVFEKTLEIGGTFKDVNELTSSFSDNLGAAIIPSKEVLQNMVEFSKATGIANTEAGKMYASFSKFFFSQQSAQKQMNQITLLARSAGLDAKGVIDEVTTNLTKINSLGFSKGVEGLTKMALQAKGLKVNIADIGALTLSQSLWDPKKAIELAQNMQMYGGQVGKLGDAFQVFRMGAYDAEKLQEEMINVTAEAFKMNKETGEYESTFVSRQRLKAQADAMGMTYEKAAEIGKERRKQLDIEQKLLENAQIASKVKSGTITDEQLTLIKTLTEFKKDKDGKVTMNLDVPGLGKIDDLEAALKDPTKTQQLTEGLKEYQRIASMDDRKIAEANLSVTETQAIDVKQIRDAIFLNLKPGQREQLLTAAENIRKTSENYGQAISTGANVSASAFAEIISKQNTKKTNQGSTMVSRETEMSPIENQDLFMGGGNNKIITDEKGGFAKKLIKEDDIIAMPKGGMLIDTLANFYNDTVESVNKFTKNKGNIKDQQPEFNFESAIERQRRKLMEFETSKEKTVKEERVIKEESNVTVNDMKLTLDVKGMTPELSKMFENQEIVNSFKNLILSEMSKQAKGLNKKTMFGKVKNP